MFGHAWRVGRIGGIEVRIDALPGVWRGADEERAHALYRRALAERFRSLRAWQSHRVWGPEERCSLFRRGPGVHASDFVLRSDEIAEAFTCAVGMAIPTELSETMKADGRPLIDPFRAARGAARPVSIQRWCARRATLTVALGTRRLVLAGMLVDSVRAGLT